MNGRGFTLIEVLVAVFVFGLLAAIAYASLDSLAGVSESQRERARAFAGLQRAVAALDADLRQLVTRRGRDRRGRLLPAFSGEPGRLLGRRAGRANPAGLPRSQLQQFRWAMDDSGSDPGLVRVTWPDVEADPEAAPAGRFRFSGVTALELRFRDAAGRWHSGWPAGGPAARLPTAIEYTLVTERFGRVRRLIAL